jgi:hypothetical protein
MDPAAIVTERLRLLQRKRKIALGVECEGVEI